MKERVGTPATAIFAKNSNSEFFGGGAEQAAIKDLTVASHAIEQWRRAAQCPTKQRQPA